MRSISLLLDASLMMANFPDGCPAARGVKATVKLELWPAARTSGKAGAVILKSAFEAAELAMVTLTVDAFVRETVRVLEAPTTTVPKSRLELPARRRPLWGVELLPPRTP
jgi:hypothetical protein